MLDILQLQTYELQGVFPIAGGGLTQKIAELMVAGWRGQSCEAAKGRRLCGLGARGVRPSCCAALRGSTGEPLAGASMQAAAL